MGTRDDAVRARVLHVLITHVGPPMDAPGVTEGTRLWGHGLTPDSLDALNLMCAIEEEFDLVIEDGVLTVEHLKTVGSLVSFVEAQLGR